MKVRDFSLSLSPSLIGCAQTTRLTGGCDYLRRALTARCYRPAIPYKNARPFFNSLFSINPAFSKTQSISRTSFSQVFVPLSLRFLKTSFTVNKGSFKAGKSKSQSFFEENLIFFVMFTSFLSVFIHGLQNLRRLFSDWTGAFNFVRISSVSHSRISRVISGFPKSSQKPVSSLKTEYTFFLRGLFRLEITVPSFSIFTIVFTAGRGTTIFSEYPFSVK